MRVRLALLALAPLTVLGCGGDDPTAVDAIPIEGTWFFEAEMSGGGQSCAQTNTTLVIQQSGSTFSGTITGGVWSCTDGIATIDIDLNGSTLDVRNGRIDGQAISFQIVGTQGGAASLTGTVGVNTMSGTGSWSGDTATLTGVWSVMR